MSPFDHKAYEADMRHLVEERLSLVEVIFRWVLEEDRKERHLCKSGRVNALSVVRWAQAGKLDDRTFAEAMIKHLVTSIDLMSEKLLEHLRNDPGPSIIMANCPHCGRYPIEIKSGRGPIEIKKEGG